MLSVFLWRSVAYRLLYHLLSIFILNLGFLLGQMRLEQHVEMPGTQ